MNRELKARKLIALPPKLIQALGEVSARYGQIEHLLTMAIHRTSGLSYDEAFQKVEELRYRDQIRKEAKRRFREWVSKKFGETEGTKRSAEFDDLIREWTDLAARRDDVIHCSWSVGIDDNQLSGARKGALLQKHGRPFEIKDVEELAIELRHFVARLNVATKLDWASESEKSWVTILQAKHKPGYEPPSALETTASAPSFNPGERFVVNSSDN